MAEFNKNVPLPQTPSPASGCSGTAKGTISLQLTLSERRPTNSDKRVMWEIATTQSNQSTKRGARLKDVIEQAEENGISCRRAFGIVRSWLRSDALRKSPEPNRIIPDLDR